MKTNAKLMTGFLLTGSLIAPSLYAQVGSGPENKPEVTTLAPGSPVPPRHGMERPGGPGGPGRGHLRGERLDNHRGLRGGNRGLTALTTVTGTIGQLTGNDDYILNGFTLKTASGSLTTVKFPAHLGQSVQQAVKPGNTVSVTGFTDTPARRK
jgi:hypothetical protein